MPAPRIVLVVAAARNGVIGADGQLPWRMPSDLKLFKALTIGKPLIMGRKTFAAIGRPLPHRDNIVVTRSPETLAAVDGIEITHTIEAALARAGELAQERGADEISVIGGAEVYRQTLRHADRVYLTRIDADPVGDAAFETPSEPTWRLSDRRPIEIGPTDDHRAELEVYDRAQAACDG